MKKSKKNVPDDYALTGSFSRISGHPNAPGSWKPEKTYLPWRIMIVTIGAAFLLTGMFFVIF